MTDVKKTIMSDAELCETELQKLLDADHIGEGKLQEAMRYATVGGGKRIRACLVLETCKMFSSEPLKAIRMAAAIEMIHAYSLVHDDLPCMDNDDIRRGKPSCHVVFGESGALLAGDTLLTYAMEVASESEGMSAKATSKAVKCLAYNAGALGMAGGQQEDLDGVCGTYENLKKLHSMKTGALIKAAVTLGYIVACDGNTEEAVLSDLAKYAECIGLAFQIKDDILDYEGDAVVLGKKVGIDKENGRVNALSFFSLQQAKDECDKLAGEASEVISHYCNSEFLAELPFYLNSRNK